MGLFRRLLGGSDEAADEAAHSMQQAVDDPISRLLAQHGLPALDNQLHLEDLVGEADWLLDQGAGTITFGGEKAFPAQVLGTRADSSRTWLWAWANPSVPEHVTSDARVIRAYGEQHGIEEFTRAELPLTETVSGEALALIASQLTDADAYYRGPYEGGAVFVMLRLPEDAPRQIHGDGLRAVRTLSTAPFALPVPLSRDVVESYLRWVGLETEDRGRELTGRDSSGRAVTIRFDGLGRIERVSSTLSPP